MSGKTVGYAEFLELRKRLSDSLVKLSKAFAELGAEERAKCLLDAKDNLESDSFRLMIAGEFKRGKSTLINAMLGQDVLPAKVAPCTAVITRVAYGDSPKAVLHYKEDTKQPLTISVDDLKKYVIIDEDAETSDEDEQANAIGCNLYELAEVFYPLPLCKNNVEIVDSPGLNEQKTRTRVTLEFLSRADALVVVLSCQQALSQSELDFIDDKLKGRNLRHVFFVWNHFDIIAESPDDIEDIKKRSRKYLEPRVGSTDRIFYVSARSALIGRKSNQPDNLAQSKLPQFESALERFLAEERGRVKLLNPLRAAETAVRDAVAEIIPRKENMLVQPLEALQARYNQQKPRLQEAEGQRERLLRSIERRREALIREAEASYQNLAVDLEGGIKKRLGEIDVGTWEIITSKSSAKQKLAKPVEAWLKTELKDWQETDLSKLFEVHLKELEDDLNEQAKDFHQNLLAIHSEVTPDVKIDNSEEEVSGLSRILGATGGFFFGGIGSAIEGGAGGFGSMMKGLPVQLAVTLGLVVAGFGMPVIVAALAATGILRTIFGGKSKVEQLRDQTAIALIGALKKNTPDVLKSMRSQIEAQFQILHEKVDTATKIMIDEVAGQIQTILKERQSSDAVVKRELEVIKKVRAELLAEVKVIDALRSEVDLA